MSSIDGFGAATRISGHDAVSTPSILNWGYGEVRGGGRRMEWLSGGTCAAASEFGWLIGNASGLYALIVITILIASAPAYHPDVPRIVSDSTRTRTQWILTFAQVLLLVFWVLGAIHVGAEYISCYVTTVSLAAIVVIAPIMLLFVFTSAGWVGRASAR
jgi:hypothetical protein